MNPIETDPRYQRAADVFSILAKHGYRIADFRCGRDGSERTWRAYTRRIVVRTARAFGLKPRHMAWACKHRVTSRQWEEAFRDSNRSAEIGALAEALLTLVAADMPPPDAAVEAWVDARWRRLRSLLVARGPQPKHAEGPE